MSSDTFCLAPWVHFHANPDGKVMPCCAWDYSQFTEDYGNINDAPTVRDALNHPSFKELRRKMLAGERVAGCTRCYRIEDISASGESMRHWFNQEFYSDKTKESVDNTQEDGTADPNVVYIDVRFRNLCNLKCRMCGVYLSSSWHKEHVELTGDTNTPKFVNVDAYDKIEPLLEHVEEIYFAGGEPLLYDEHLKMLLHFIEIGNTKIKLKYNTNLTTLKFKGYDFVELWKHFDSVVVGASIDGTEDTVEYIRTGVKWDVLKSNFERIQKEAPHVHIFASPTISVLSLEPFFEFYDFCIENDWLARRAFTPNFVTSPFHYNLQYMPKWYRDKMIARVEKGMQKLILEGNGIYADSLRIVKSFMAESPISEEECDNFTMQLYNIMNTHDITANLNWRKQLPHMDQFFIEFFQRRDS